MNGHGILSSKAKMEQFSMAWYYFHVVQCYHAAYCHVAFHIIYSLMTWKEVIQPIESLLALRTFIQLHSPTYSL